MKKVLLSCLIFFNILAINVFAGNHFQLEAIFFDMDGVLVDTEHLKYQAWKQALNEKLKIDFSLNDYIPLVGLSSEEILEKIIKLKTKLQTVKFNKAELIKYKNARYQAIQAKGIQPIPPAVELLKNLLQIKNQHNIKIGIVSSAKRAEIFKNLGFIGIDPKKLDAIASGDDDLKDITDPEGTNKPKPYIYQKIASWLKVTPQNCVVFEDTNAGVEAAYSAGMKVYAVPNRFTKNHDFSHSIGILNSLKSHTTIELLNQLSGARHF